jgi:hypothetical protein
MLFSGKASDDVPADLDPSMRLLPCHGRNQVDCELRVLVSVTFRYIQ